MHPPLSSETTGENTLPSWEKAFLSTSSPPPLQAPVIPFVWGGVCDLKCKREGYWKIPAVPQPAFALLRSDWAARAPQWMCWLGGCWPRWLTAALGTAIHCRHVSRWCMRKMQGGLGRGPRGACLMLMMQQRTHQRCYWPETQACVVYNEDTAVTNPDLLDVNGYYSDRNLTEKVKLTKTNRCWLQQMCSFVLGDIPDIFIDSVRLPHWAGDTFTV